MEIDHFAPEKLYMFERFDPVLDEFSSFLAQMTRLYKSLLMTQQSLYQ